jgi:hypothetical protein
MSKYRPIYTNYDFKGSSRIVNLPRAVDDNDPLILEQAVELFSQATLLSGVVDPTPGLGKNGDFYINRLSGDLFGPKENGQWPDGVSLLVPGPKGDPGPPKAISIDSPRTGDEFTLFYTQYPTTITQALGVVRGTNPSVTFELRYSNNRSNQGTLACVPKTITNSTTGELIVVQNMPIPPDNYLWVKITQVEGTVREFNVSVEI